MVSPFYLFYPPPLYLRTLWRYTNAAIIIIIIIIITIIIIIVVKSDDLFSHYHTPSSLTPSPPFQLIVYPVFL